MFQSLFWRPLARAVSCALFLTLLLPLTVLAKSASHLPYVPLALPVTQVNDPSPGPIHVTTDAPCSNPTPVVEIRVSAAYPSLTVDSHAFLSSTDPDEHSHAPTLIIFNTDHSYQQKIPYDGNSHNFHFTSTKNDMLKACVDGADGDETGDISFKGTVVRLTDNYAGYASTGLNAQPLTYSDVSGSWKVSQVHCSVNLYGTDSAVWVGLGGLFPGNNDIAQIGVESGCTGGPFSDKYKAVYQMVPEFTNGRKEITKDYACRDNTNCTHVDPTIRPGDNIFAEVTYNPDKRNYTLFIHDLTQKWHSDLPAQRGNDSPPARYSAEWIVEAPENLAGQIKPLANFGTINFSNCLAQVEGSTSENPINIGPVTYQVRMTYSTPKAETRPLDSTGTSFSVRWNQE